MDAVRCYTLDFFPENILIDILSYLNVRELVRNSRVCRRWKQLVKDQRLWRAVDLSTWKRVTSRVLWAVLRQYLGHGLRLLRLRGLLLSARAGVFLSESWLRALRSKCPRLRTLCLTHTDLRGLPSVRLLPLSLQVLELHFCEVPAGFFSEGDGVETLVLDSVPSFSDQHLRSLSAWRGLTRLELRDLIRVTVAGLKSCVPPGAHTLACLTHLELQTGSRTQMVALGLGEGWPGLERLSLGGKEVGPGLLSLGRLQDLRSLRLRSCRLTQMMVLRSCRCLTRLRLLEFVEVEFVEDEVRSDESDRPPASDADPAPSLRRALRSMLPACATHFTRCTRAVNKD